MDREELIEKYIQGRVSEKELEIIRELIQTDADFREELTFESGLRHAIKQEERQDLKSLLEELEKRQKQQPNSDTSPKEYHQTKEKETKKILHLSVLGKAAAVLLVGLGAWWFLGQSPDHHSLYQAYYQPYPNIVAPTVRGPEDTVDHTAEAFRLYDGKEYKAAASLFERLASQEEETGFAPFYQAQSLMADGREQEAIAVLENPNWSIPDNLRTQTEWYLALAHLKTGNKEKSRQLFEQIEASNSAKSEEARNILDQME